MKWRKKEKWNNAYAFGMDNKTYRSVLELEMKSMINNKINIEGRVVATNSSHGESTVTSETSKA